MSRSGPGGWAWLLAGVLVALVGLGWPSPGWSLEMTRATDPALIACEQSLTQAGTEPTALQVTLARCAVDGATAPDSPLWLYRGLALYRLGDYGAAIAAFSRYLDRENRSAIAYYNRGLAHSALGDSTAALGDYLKAAAALESWQPEAQANLYNDLGLLYFTQGQAQVALAYLDYAIALNDQDPRGYFNRGCVCHHQHHYQAAIAAFEQVLVRSPEFGDAYVNRGMARYGLGDRAGAIADLETAAQHFHRQGQTQAHHQVQQLLHRLQIRPTTLG